MIFHKKFNYLFEGHTGITMYFVLYPDHYALRVFFLLWALWQPGCVTLEFLYQTRKIVSHSQFNQHRYLSISKDHAVGNRPEASPLIKAIMNRSDKLLVLSRSDVFYIGKERSWDSKNGVYCGSGLLSTQRLAGPSPTLHITSYIKRFGFHQG